MRICNANDGIADTSSTGGALSDSVSCPYWQGGYGYYQGSDPDQFIRSQMMRDPVHGPWR
jgi:hypothetical protein